MVRCVTPNDSDYDESRIISNARFDYHPASICYCEKEEDVAEVLKSAKSGFVRIRSGGHQHEGMCSGKDVTIVDVSKINKIEIATNRGLTMKVGAGARLGDVYKKLWTYRRLLPGGGCADVCVGGLVQGGGWGPYSRALGLTCDQLTGFRMVKADGCVVDVNDNDDPDSLMWAIRGGGGGNFGVITHFFFDLAVLESQITSFTVRWFDRGLTEKVINDWRFKFPSDPDVRLTSFCRLTVLAGGASNDPPIVVSGFFQGEQPELERILPRLLPNTWASKYDVVYNRVDTTGGEEGEGLFQLRDYQPGPPVEALRSMPRFADFKGDLASTCDGIPFPHKVSSCFPREGFGEGAVERIAGYLFGSKTESTARRYLSLHSMGGAIATAKKPSCFPYRTKPFILQYQAWWANKEDCEVEERCKAWVEGFRKEMSKDTEGSFINFPDRDLPAADLKELLEYYYGPKNLQQLIYLKYRNDPGNLFKFDMGIPIS